MKRSYKISFLASTMTIAFACLDDAEYNDQEVVLVGVPVNPYRSTSIITDDDFAINFTSDYVFDEGTGVNISFSSDATSVVSKSLQDITLAIEFYDIPTGEKLGYVTGILHTGGGLEELEDSQLPESYMAKTLDVLADGGYLLDSVTTSYNPDNADSIRQALTDGGYLSKPNRKKTAKAKILPANKAVIQFPISDIYNTIKVGNFRYTACADITNLPLVELLADSATENNNHFLVDLGDTSDVNAAIAKANSLALQDHRCQLFWSPNTSKDSPYSKRRHRPIVGDMLGKILARNEQETDNGNMPVHIPIGGSTDEVSQNSLETMDGFFTTDDDIKRLAKARINLVRYVNFHNGGMFAYVDALTQYEDDKSILALANSSEIATYVENLVTGFAKATLLNDNDANVSVIERFIEKTLGLCANDGMLVESSNPLLAGKYFAFTVTKVSPQKIVIRMSFTPTGCTRQIEVQTTIEI